MASPADHLAARAWRPATVGGLEALVETAPSWDEADTPSPEEWRRRQAAVRVITRQVAGRAEQLELLQMLGLLPVGLRVA